jgi:hypothetical protein
MLIVLGNVVKNIYNFFMKSLFNKKYYRNIVWLITLLCFLSFFSVEQIMHPIFKHISFIIFLTISIYFIPFQLYKITFPQNKIIEIISKFLISLTIIYMAISSIFTTKSLEIIGEYLIIITGLFTFYIVFDKRQINRDMLVTHFLINFMLIGVKTMFY